MALPVAPLDAALADLKLQDVPNIRGTARKFGVIESTLRRRHKGQTVSAQEASHVHKQRLSPAEERALIDQINDLTDRGIPPTVSMVRNFAEEMIEASVGKNWAANFVRRHNDQLKSLYLRNIDNSRIKAEYVPMFKRYFEGVSLFNVRRRQMLTIL